MKTLMNWLALIGIILLMIFGTGCYSPQKAIQQVDKALNKYPEVAADKIRKAFPCIPTAYDSTGYLESISKLDSLLNEANIELADRVDRYEQIKDSLENAIKSDTSIVGCEDENKMLLDFSSKLQVRNEQLEKQNKQFANTITALSKETKNLKPVIIKIKDSADVFLARKEANEWRDKYLIDHDWRTKMENKLKGKYAVYIPKWIIWLLALSMALVIYSKIKIGVFNPLRLFSNTKSSNMKSLLFVLITLSILPGCAKFKDGGGSVWQDGVWIIPTLLFLASGFFGWKAWRAHKSGWEQRTLSGYFSGKEKVKIGKTGWIVFAIAFFIAAWVVIIIQNAAK